MQIIANFRHFLTLFHMGSGITYPHKGGPLWPPLVFSALRLPTAQNLVSDKYFDFFLSIDTKNSPLSDILFALRAVE